MKKQNSLITLIVSIIGGLLGAMSGADNSSKIFRRFLIPGMLTGIAYWQTESILVLSIMLMSALFSLGYGVPSPDDPKPSDLGKFFYGLCHQNVFWTNIFTRGTIGVCVCLTLISIPIIRHNWKIYTIVCAVIIFAYTCLSWRDLGVYQFFKWQLLWSETVLYGTITIASLILVMK